MTMFDIGRITVENATHETDDRRILWIVEADETASIAFELLGEADGQWMTVDNDPNTEERTITLSAANGRVVYRVVGEDLPRARVIVERLTPWPIP